MDALPPLAQVEPQARGRARWKCTGCGTTRLMSSEVSAVDQAWRHAEEYPCPAVEQLDVSDRYASEEVTVTISGTAAVAIQIDTEPWSKYEWRTVRRGKGSSERCTMPRAEAIAFAQMCIENASNSGWDGELQHAWYWAGRNARRLLEELGVEE